MIVLLFRKTGLFEGSLSQTTTKLRDFLKCPKSVSKDSSESTRDIFTSFSNRLNQDLDIVWLFSAFLVLMSAMAFLAYTIVRYFDVIHMIRKKKFSKLIL
jgi:hypothetical protein